MEQIKISKKRIEFGFQQVSGKNIIVSEKNKLKAKRKDPGNDPYDAVVYGTEPLKGTTEFEIEIECYDNTKWSGSVQLGVSRLKQGSDLRQSQIPRLSEHGDNHCIWLSNEIHNRLDGGQHIQSPYGSREEFHSLREGGRVGFRLTHNGDLYFFLNGKCQGIAASGVYKTGYDVYPVVDVTGGCTAVKITRAGNVTLSITIYTTLSCCIVIMVTLQHYVWRSSLFSNCVWRLFQTVSSL